MPDDILDAAQKAINEAAGKLPDTVVSPAEPAPEPMTVPVVSPPTEPPAAKPAPVSTPPIAPESPPVPPPHPPPDDSKLVESILESGSAKVVPPPPPKPKDIPRKKSVSGAVIGIIALLILALPVGVYYLSQRNQQLADIRSQAFGLGEYPTNSPLAIACQSGNTTACNQLCGGSGGAGQTCAPPGTGCATQGGTACTSWHWTTCIGGGTNGVGCGTGGGGGGGGNPTNTPRPPTPTPTSVAHECTNLKIVKDGAQVTPSSLLPGDTVSLVVSGNGNPTKAHFRINGGAWQEVTSGSNQFTLAWTVPSDVTDFVLEAEVFVDGVWK